MPSRWTKYVNNVDYDDDDDDDDDTNISEKHTDLPSGIKKFPKYRYVGGF